MDPGGPDPHDCCPPGVIKSLLTNLFGLVYTGQKLTAGLFDSKGQRNGGQLIDAVDAKLNVLILELVYEDRHGVERVIAVSCRHLSSSQTAASLSPFIGTPPQ